MVRELDRTLAGSTSTDAELAARAAAGEGDAFDELYRRHADAAWRVAQAVAANADDAADAVAEAFVNVFQALPSGRLTQDVPFRPYLLKATRNAAIDTLRRGQRVQPSADVPSVDEPTPAEGPSEAVLIGEEVALVAGAFRALPERWRSVLWMTEVEGMPARDVAGVLGMSPNAVAQLSLRARAGLRKHYLQAHVTNGVGPGCRDTVNCLGAYVAGALPRRDVVKVERHLDDCADCQTRLSDVEDVGSTLRKLVLPIPLGVAGAVAAARPARAAGRLVLSAAHRFVAGTAAVVLGLGITGALVAPQGGGSTPHVMARVPAAMPTVSAAPVESTAATNGAQPEVDGRTGADAVAGSAQPSAVQRAASSTTTATSIPAGPHPPASPPPTASAPVVAASVNLGVAGIGLAAGTCTNVALEPTAGGCIQQPPAAPGVSLDVLGLGRP